jgi:hypothetical protein
MSNAYSQSISIKPRGQLCAKIQPRSKLPSIVRQPYLGTTAIPSTRGDFRAGDFLLTSNSGRKDECLPVVSARDSSCQQSRPVARGGVDKAICTFRMVHSTAANSSFGTDALTAGQSSVPPLLFLLLNDRAWMRFRNLRIAWWVWWGFASVL